eukprot:6203797-Pleurochrysis_carterae.AAC.3
MDAVLCLSSPRRSFIRSKGRQALRDSQRTGSTDHPTVACVHKRCLRLTPTFSRLIQAGRPYFCSLTTRQFVSLVCMFGRREVYAATLSSLS